MQEELSLVLKKMVSLIVRAQPAEEGSEHTLVITAAGMAPRAAAAAVAAVQLQVWCELRCFGEILETFLKIHRWSIMM